MVRASRAKPHPRVGLAGGGAQTMLMRASEKDVIVRKLRYYAGKEFAGLFDVA
ncbi:MAG: hypothetical protein ABL909_10230 [Sphingopyxis sp.]